MNWGEQRTRLRRFLRDPDEQIWTNSELLRLFNIEQVSFQNIHGEIQDVTIVRLPPLFQMSYMHEWEWSYSEHTLGYVYSCIGDRNYYDQAEIACTYRWETQHIAGQTGPLSELGDFYTQPWEAWLAPSGTPSDAPPVWAAKGFLEAIFMAVDKEPLEPITEKEVMSYDRTWRTRAGKSTFYWRSEKLENFIHIYPLRSSVDWSDTTPEGMVVAGLDATGSGESYGAIIDYTGAYSNQDSGVAVDLLSKDNNLLTVYKKEPSELEEDSDVSDFPAYFTKYIEYGVLEKAYKMNTDGEIGSLADYWGFRKKVAQQIVDKLKAKKLVDRDFQLKTHITPPQRRQRHARLPDTYPSVW